MLILSSFPDRISCIQVLNRVGRFGDKCVRIRDTTFEEIDGEENARRKGELEALMIKIVALKAKINNAGEGLQPSRAQFED